MLPDPRECPTIGVEEAGRLCGFGRAKAYAEAQRFERSGGAEGLPVIRFGRTLRVPVAALRRILELPQRDGAPPERDADHTVDRPDRKERSSHGRS